MAEVTQREKDLQAIAEFRMFDDTFMPAVFDGQIAETELLLRVVLGKDDIQVESSEAQFYISNIYGHEARLDILARDHQGKAYNVEVQRMLSGASVQRARFNAAMVDVTLLKKGEPHQALPDRYTIFITEDDMFDKGLPAYHASNKIDELDNAALGDGGYIVYINGQYRNVDTPIGKLMHDFFCENADDILNPLLKDRVKYLSGLLLRYSFSPAPHQFIQRLSHIGRQERRSTQYHPFGNIADHFPNHRFRGFSGYSRGFRENQKIIAAQVCLFAVYGQGKFFFVLRHDYIHR